MKQWIRWPGLITFIVIVALLLAFFMLAAGPLSKRAIESLGAQAVGAKVDVERVSLSLSPLGLIVHNVQIADVDQPMQNAVQVQRAVARIELAPLLLGKVIVHDLQVEQVQFNTARAVSGALTRVAKDDDQKSVVEDKTEPSSWSVDLPSFEDLLARQSLQTDRATEQAQVALTASQQRLDAASGALPNEHRVTEYEQQVQSIFSGSIDSLDEFRRRQQALRDVQQQINADRDAIRTARQALQRSQQEMSDGLSALRAAPAADMAQLRSQYQLDGDGAANMSALLFGEQAGEWARMALHWYEKVRPYLASSNASDQDVKRERLQGRYVHFQSDDPWPSFLIRQAHVSMQLEQGSFVLDVVDVTHQQRVLKRPLRAWLRSEQLANADSIKATLVIDHRQSPSNDLLDVTIKDYRLTDMNLGLGGAKLQQALVQLDTTVVVLSDQMDAQLRATARNADFRSEGDTQFARELSTALAGIDQFTVQASAEGTLWQPRVKFGSDLDTQLQAAFSQRLREQQVRLERQLEAHLNQQVAEYRQQYESQLQQIERYEQQFAELQQRFESLQAHDLGEYADYQQRQAEQKAKAAEEKAAAEARERQRELESQARDRVRRLF